MLHRLWKIVAVVLLALAGSACSVTRNVPEGEYVLQSVKIKVGHETPRSERVSSDELEKYIRQSPNTRFLGTNLYVNLYNMGDKLYRKKQARRMRAAEKREKREKPKPIDKSIKKPKRKRKKREDNLFMRLGERAVLLDRDLTMRSADNLKVYVDSKGYFSSKVDYRIDTTSRRKRASVTYFIEQGEPYRIDTITYEFRDRFLEQIVKPDAALNTLLHKDDIFDITRLDLERERIAGYLKTVGFYNFTIGNIEYEADTLMGGRRAALKMIVKQNPRYNEQGRATWENNMIYRINRINIYPDYNPTAQRRRNDIQLDTTRYRGLNIISEGHQNLRSRVLRHTVPIYPNYIYNSEMVNRTYTDLMALGYFKSVRMTFNVSPETDYSQSRVSFVGAADSLLERGNDTKEGYLECNIHCTPMLKQSVKADLEGSVASSFYGLKGTLGYQNRNIFRGAESFDTSVSLGYEWMKNPEAKRRNATEFGVTAGVTFPHFLLPWRQRRYRSVNQPKTKVEVSLNFQDRPYYERVLSSAGVTYLWTNNHYSSFSLRPVDINVINVTRLDSNFLQIDSTDPENQGMVQNKYLKESFRTQFVGGLSFSYTFNNQRKDMSGNSTNIRFNLETAGNLIGGVKHLFFSPPAGGGEREIFGIPYSQYFRTDLSASHKITLGAKTALVGRLYGGVAMAYGNSSAVPFDRQFYSGGSNGMRGWAPRTLGQGSVLDPNDAFPIQTGDVKLEANLELRFPIWGMIRGATFFDLGNIWYIRHNEANPDGVFHFNNFYRQLGFNTGLGLRLDIKFFVLRLDWGIKLHNPNNPAGERWIQSFKFSDTAINFGVGYPF